MASRKQRENLPKGVFARDRKKGRVYGIAFMWQGEQQQETVGLNKAEAIRRLGERRKQVADGTYSPEHKTGEVTARTYAKTWGEGRKNKTARDDRTRLTKHFVPYLGDMKMADIRPRHIIKWVKDLAAAGTIAPASIHNVYGNVCTMFRDAVIDEIIAATPCVIPDGTLPPLPDKTPGIYEKPSIVKLLTAPEDKVPWDRRVFYWLAFFTGMRHGEVAGRRWRDWDRDGEPLTALHCRTQYKDQILKSPDGKPRPRVIPVHPLLRAALEDWRDNGFPRFFGRKPKPEDYIVPSRRGGKGEHHRTVRRSLTNLVERDCPAVKVEPLTFHRTRDTFISLCRRAGAPRDVVERITHNAKGETIDVYTHLDWVPLCAAVQVIELPVNQPPLLPHPAVTREFLISMSPSMSTPEGETVLTAVELETERGGRDSNTSPPPRQRGTTRERRTRAPRKETPVSSDDPDPDPSYGAGHTASDFDVALREHLGAQPPASLPVRELPPAPSTKERARG